jgi:hypothetical protein
MMPGFVEVDCHTFYADVWERIKRDVEAVESNWAEAKKGARPIVIKWGYKNDETGEKVIVAITHADNTGDKHWVVEGFASNGVKT